VNFQAGWSNGSEQSVGEQREGDVTMPANPAPYLVVREAYLSFGLLKSDLHPPERLPATFANFWRVVFSGAKTV
jgi:hypothetical protein